MREETLAHYVRQLQSLRAQLPQASLEEIAASLVRPNGKKGVSLSYLRYLLWQERRRLPKGLGLIPAEAGLFCTSDWHVGDARALLRSVRSMFARLKAVAPEGLVVVVAGDLIAGRGVYRGQEHESLGLEDQTHAAALFLAELEEELGRRVRWVLIRGNHDRGAEGEDALRALVGLARSLGLEVRYCGSLALFTCGETVIAVIHGEGYSRYNPHPPGLQDTLRRLWCNLMERGVRVHRFVHGHTHWLSCGTYFGNYVVDSVGGFQACFRHGRALLPQSPPGGLLYLPDGRVHVLCPAPEVFYGEFENPSLPEENAREYARLLGEVRRRLGESGGVVAPSAFYEPGLAEVVYLGVPRLAYRHGGGVNGGGPADRV